MFTLAAITLEGLRNFIIVCAFIALFAGLLLFSVGCNSPLRAPRSSPPAPRSTLPARPSIAHDQSTGMYTWHFLAANGVMVHQSPMAFHSSADLIAHYAEVRRLMQAAERPTTITRPADDKGGHRWALYDESTGQRLEITDQPFATANAARTNYDTLRTAVIATPPQDLDTTTIPF